MADLSIFDPNQAGNPDNNIFGLPFTEDDAKLVLLPVRSENIICQSASTYCSRNELNFRNYRKFGATSDITFEKD